MELAQLVEPRLTIIVTTVGRHSVARTLQSLEGQDWLEGDQVLLVCDGHIPQYVSRLWLSLSLPGRLMLASGGPHQDWGHTPRNRALRYATGDYVAHLDDDDCYRTNAVPTIRRELHANGEGFYFFQMEYPGGGVRWVQPGVSFGNVGTPMFVHPRKCILGEWGSFYGGDWQFMKQTVACNPALPIFWISKVICHIRPQVKLDEIP
jgi:hypothetical protein